MSCFDKFPDLPGPEETAFCKINEVYCCGDARYGNISTFTNSIKNHPKINVTKDFHHHKLSDENISMYVDVEDNLLKRITSVWFKQGFLEALSVAADPNDNRDSKARAAALKVANLFTALRKPKQPHLKDIGEKIVSKYSRTRNWGSAPVKCMAWHPHTTKIALATADDYVRVYCSEVSFVSTLKCKAQRHVSTLSWRPYSASEIAVGCEQGVIVWTVDPNSTFTKPSSSNAVVLKRSGHSPVTDISWSPCGKSLLSCCVADKSILLWDVAKGTAKRMFKTSFGHLILVSWVSKQKKVGWWKKFAEKCHKFRLFGVQSVRREPLVAKGCRAFCWGPNGVGLFAPRSERCLFVVNDTSSRRVKTRDSQEVLDLTKVELPTGDTVGGRILDMCWDPTGRYLALLFKKSYIIAVFNTTQHMMQLNVTPCCYIRGVDNEVPSTFAFQQNFKDGACLTIAWSSGRIQYFPIINTDS
ncbi:unnamed protein product [Euphydryas editha]|uniref:Aladin seven-bladed propeller domain-containing protein n=1 Tax=Euphydryas editha TaxID=104508 RepID=A0AAU9U1S6_EUPED|nr:unnamed protein product [Euphydryas editha]